MCYHTSGTSQRDGILGNQVWSNAMISFTDKENRKRVRNAWIAAVLLAVGIILAGPLTERLASHVRVFPIFTTAK